MKDFFQSFVFAFRGFVCTFKNERNMRIHMCFAFYVVLAGIVSRISTSEWTVVLICIGAVTALECVNTSIESLCDTVHPDRSESIRYAKDIAAGAVLCAAAVSAVAGCIIFFQKEKLENVWLFANNEPFVSTVILLTLIPLTLFARGKKGKNKK